MKILIKIGIIILLLIFIMIIILKLGILSSTKINEMAKVLPEGLQKPIHRLTTEIDSLELKETSIIQKEKAEVKKLSVRERLELRKKEIKLLNK